MENNRKITQDCAMRFGTYMGLFWAAKFVLFPLGLTIPILTILFAILTMFVPILGYKFAKTYRDKFNGGYVSFWNAFMFCMSMFVYATLLVSVVQYIYFQFIDNGYIINTYSYMLKDFERTAGSAQFTDSIDKFKEILKMISSFSPFQLVFEIMSTNIYYGIMMSLPISLIIKRKNINQE